jgi:hypothetical protein
MEDFFVDIIPRQLIRLLAKSKDAEDSKNYWRFGNTIITYFQGNRYWGGRGGGKQKEAG